jgi:hypothetical protein
MHEIIAYLLGLLGIVIGFLLIFLGVSAITTYIFPVESSTIVISQTSTIREINNKCFKNGAEINCSAITDFPVKYYGWE